MPDIATISAFITSVKNATDIAKAIRGADVSLEKAETKLKMAELIESLADARMQAAEIQEIILDKDKRIAELEKAFELKSKLVRQGDAYYEMDESGGPVGDPYCSHCWEANHKTVHVNYDMYLKYKSCPACKTEYEKRRAKSFMQAIEPESAT